MQNHLKLSINKTRQNKAKYWPEILQDLGLWRRTACQTLSKALNIPSNTARVAPDLLKSLETPLDASVSRSAVDQKDLKPYWNAEKRPHFLRWSTSWLFTNLSKTLLTTEKRLTGRYFLAVELFPTFLNTGITDDTLQHSHKQDSLIQILNSSFSMYESSGPQLFIFTPRIPSGSDAFNKSRLIMIFLTMLRLTEILCSFTFRLLLEGKSVKEIPSLQD